MRRKHSRRSDGFGAGSMIKTGVGNLVGLGMLGASAQAVGGLPAGMAKDISGITVGLQATSMLGPNLKNLKKQKLI